MEDGRTGFLARCSPRIPYFIEGFNFAQVMDTVTKHTAELKKLEKELMDLESIFPKDFVNSTDVAYQNYKKLKKDLDEELAFQVNYARVLDFFFKDAQTRGNVFSLLGSRRARRAFRNGSGKSPPFTPSG